MLTKAERDASGAFVMEGEVALGMDAQVVHIDLQPVFGNHIGEDMIHKRLKSGWSITEPKEHDSGFKESKRSDERSFPLVFFANANVVESPSDIELGKDHGVLHIVDQFGNKGQGVRVVDSVGVQVPIVLARAK